MTTLRDRYRGSLLGLACGDAVGTTVEFSMRGSFEPMTDMIGGGPFELAAGQWTDDTSMALCLATSLLYCHGFDAVDQMNRYVNWWQWGYLSSTDECFDIGMTVAKALQRYQVSQDPMAGSTDPNTAGNGALMRLAPVILFFGHDLALVRRYARLSTATTHAAPEAIECSELFGDLLARTLQGLPKEHLFPASNLAVQTLAVRLLAAGDFLCKPVSAVTGSGYCVASLEAALWCFMNTASFEEAVLQAANLGDDADTTAAITGQIAGAYYGADAIPASWLSKLHMHGEIDRLACELLAQSIRQRDAVSS